HGDAPARERAGDEIGGPLLLEAELGMCVKVPPQRLDCRGLGSDRFNQLHRVSARKPLTSVRGGIALQSCPSRVSLSTQGGTAEYRGIVGASRPVGKNGRTLTRSARSNNRCSLTRK